MITHHTTTPQKQACECCFSPQRVHCMLLYAKSLFKRQSHTLSSMLTNPHLPTSLMKRLSKSLLLKFSQENVLKRQMIIHDGNHWLLTEAIKRYQFQTIDASGMGIHLIPECIFKTLHNLTPQIRSLNLSRNHLTELPSALGQLNTIEEINLYANNFKHLPPSITELSQLKWLALFKNQLVDLPCELKQLKYLQWLFLSYNFLPACERNKAKQLQNHGCRVFCDLQRSYWEKLNTSLTQVTNFFHTKIIPQRRTL